MSGQQPNPDNAAHSAFADPFGFWRALDVPFQAVRNEVLQLSETCLRKQADLLAELADAKRPSDLLVVQARHVHEFWADMLRDLLKTGATIDPGIRTDEAAVGSGQNPTA